MSERNIEGDIKGDIMGKSSGLMGGVPGGVSNAQQVCISLVPQNCSQNNNVPSKPSNYNLQVLPKAVSNRCNYENGPPQVQQQPPVTMPVREGKETNYSNLDVVNTAQNIEYMVPDMRKLNKEVEKEVLLSDFTRARELEKPNIKPLAKKIAPHIQTVSEYTTSFKGMPVHLPTQYDIRRPVGIKKTKHYVYEDIPTFVPRVASEINEPPPEEEKEELEGGITDNKYHQNKICSEPCKCEGNPINLEYRFDNNWMKQINMSRKKREAEEKQ